MKKNLRLLKLVVEAVRGSHEKVIFLRERQPTSRASNFFALNSRFKKSDLEKGLFNISSF